MSLTDEKKRTGYYSQESVSEEPYQSRKIQAGKIAGFWTWSKSGQTEMIKTCRAENACDAFPGFWIIEEFQNAGRSTRQKCVEESRPVHACDADAAVEHRQELF